MWATYPMMKEALKVIEAWGFTYKSIAFQWVKQNRSGNGYFFGLEPAEIVKRLKDAEKAAEGRNA